MHPRDQDNHADYINAAMKMAIASNKKEAAASAAVPKISTPQISTLVELKAQIMNNSDVQQIIASPHFQTHAAMALTAATKGVDAMSICKMMAAAAQPSQRAATAASTQMSEHQKFQADAVASAKARREAKYGKRT